MIDGNETETFSFHKWDNRSLMKLNDLSKISAPLSQKETGKIIVLFLTIHTTS